MGYPKLSDKIEESFDYWNEDIPMSFFDIPLTYEEKRSFRYSLQDYMYKEFSFKKFNGKVVLEIGCGAGIDTCEFLRNGSHVISLDLSEASMKATKSLLEETKLPGSLSRASVLNLPFRSNVFDCVYSFGVLHHVRMVELAMSEIVRVLKPSGLFMGMLYHKNSLMYAYLTFKNKGTERRVGCPYAKAYSMEEAYLLFHKYFKSVVVKVCYNVIDLPTQRKVKFKLENGDESLGWHLVVKARKGS